MSNALSILLKSSADAGEDEEVDIPLDKLEEDSSGICDLLENEECTKSEWLIIASAYRKLQMTEQAHEVVRRALESKACAVEEDRGRLFAFQTWLFLQQEREAPKTIINREKAVEDLKTKDYYHQLATTSLNEASRSDPRWNLASVTRGVWTTLRRKQNRLNLEDAGKFFDQSLRLGQQSQVVDAAPDIFASLGKARLVYSRKNYRVALKLYQHVLQSRPDILPDPRIGIGLCFWQLGMKLDARAAWERSVELHPSNLSTHALLGISYFDEAFQSREQSEVFVNLYKTGIKCMETAYKQKGRSPLAAIRLIAFYFSKKQMALITKLAEKVIETSDVNEILCEAYFWMARAAHLGEEHDKAQTLYGLSLQAKDDYLPSRIGQGQLQLIVNDLTHAKLSFEKITNQHPQCAEASIILGCIYANEVFQSSTKDEKRAERQKAAQLLERGRSFNESSAKKENDLLLLHLLSRLNETDNMQQSLHYSEEAAQIQEDVDGQVSPRLSNNIAVFLQATGNLDKARELYESAIERCASYGSISSTPFDTDATLTTLMYNLGRLYEEEGNTEAARPTYEKLLEQHPDYVEARLRLCFMDILAAGIDSTEASKKMKELVELDGQHLQVRALYGWYLSRHRRQIAKNLAEDVEQRHYKMTLSQLDKHDGYSLTSMGNLFLTHSKEIMRSSNTGDVEKRRVQYNKACEFFDKALQLEPRNAYAAQGVAIALSEVKQPAKAIVIFSKIRETLKDIPVFVNLGHCYTELKQYARAIENYEIALKLCEGSYMVNILTYLGRVWLQRGRDERNVTALRQALSYSSRALDLNRGNIHAMFNVAFVQFQLGEVIRTTAESRRSVTELEATVVDLDKAIRTMTEIANAKAPPYPKDDLMQRATMGKNTLRRQLERAITAQKEYEELSATRMDTARRKREEEVRRRADAEAHTKAEQVERQRQIGEERRRIAEEERIWRSKKDMEAEEGRASDSSSSDSGSAGGEKSTRKKKRRKERENGDQPKKRLRKADVENGHIAVV